MFYQMITGLITVSPVYLEKSDEFVTAEEIFYPGTTSEVTIKAFPPNGDETTAVIRYEVINGEIVSVTPLRSIAMGACENGSMYQGDLLCVDISNGEPIKDGEDLVRLEIKWGNEDKAFIKSVEGNSFFNGKELKADSKVYNFYNQSTLPFTGNEEN